jgi:hypothetical protein
MGTSGRWVGTRKGGIEGEYSGCILYLYVKIEE